MLLPPTAVDSDRVLAELNRLATFSDCAQPPPAVTRVVFTDQDAAARQYLGALLEQAGLKVRVDAIGNTFARWVGDDPDAAIVGTGSHIDAIPHAGMYDGTVGVIGGLEAIRALQSAGFRPRRSIELLLFTSEEPTRFGIGCAGSRLLAGRIEPSNLAERIDEEGISFDRARLAAGYGGPLESVPLAGDYYHAFVELHIEQGPILERENTAIGIVTAIAAPATFQFVIEGIGGHAGGVLMPDRHDAMTAAAELITAIETLAVDSPSPDLVATVGTMDVHPGAANSIPSKVSFSLDVRDIHLTGRDAWMAELNTRIEALQLRRGVTVRTIEINRDPPATAASLVVDAARMVARGAGLSHRTMVSRAYHDSLFIGQIAPMSMIFIPCRGGVSHRPDEYSHPDQIKAGIDVLAGTLAELAK